jgi:hypothetical protein
MVAGLLEIRARLSLLAMVAEVPLLFRASLMLEARTTPDPVSYSFGLTRTRFPAVRVRVTAVGAVTFLSLRILKCAVCTD